MKKYLQEFKEFAVKGNVVDLAVAVIIGGAFGKIISSLVADIVMPSVGLLLGGLDFSNWQIVLRAAVLSSTKEILEPAITMNIGIFIQNIFDFLVIAWAIFMMIRIMGRLKKKVVKEKPVVEEEPVSLTKDQELLVEICDLLKK
jgi:large conductance mechanosensitive channel